MTSGVMGGVGGVWLIARTEIRRRWVALVALGLLAGLGGAAVTSVTALARRTSTAYDRLAEATGQADAQVFVTGGDEVTQRITELPGVESAWVVDVSVALVLGGGRNYLAIGAGAPPPPGLAQPRIVEGRTPGLDAPDEVIVAEYLAGPVEERLGEVVGARVPLRFLTPEQFRSFSTGFGEPDGPEVTVEIVGVFRTADRSDTTPPMIAGPAFLHEHPDVTVNAAFVLVRLEDGSDGAAAFGRDAQRLSDDADPNGASSEAFLSLDVTVPFEARGEIDTTARVLVIGLASFAAVAAFAVLLVTAQGLARHYATGAADQAVEATLGLTPAQRTGARVVAASAMAAVAAAATITIAVMSASLEPLGGVRPFEPNPGRSVNLAVVGLGTVLTVLVVFGVAALTARRAGRKRPVRRERVSRDTRRLGRMRGGPVGVRFAFGRGPDAASVPVRSALAGLMVGFLGVSAALVFAAGLNRVVDTPERYGWSGDLSIVDSRPELDQELVADDRISAVTRYESAAVRIDDGQVDAYSFEQLKGDAGWWTITGRPPAIDDEVMVGLRLARELDVGVGDIVMASSGSDPRDLRVVGIGVGAPSSEKLLGEQALLTPGGFESLRLTEGFTESMVTVAPGQDATEVADAYSEEWELTIRSRPSGIQNLADLGRLPELLAAFLAVVAIAALANALVVAVRRRRHELAVLRVVGYTPRQTAGAIATMSVASAAVGVVIGCPLGIAAGRVLWRLVAESSAVEGDALVPVGVLLALAGTLLAASLVISAVPAWRAARLRPADLLRAE